LASNILNDNLETLQPAFNISQMHDKLCCFFDGRVTRVVYDTPVVARILCEIQSDCGRGPCGVKEFILKLRNSHKNGKIDLLCISVWDGAGLY